MSWATMNVLHTNFTFNLAIGQLMFAKWVKISYNYSNNLLRTFCTKLLFSKLNFEKQNLFRVILKFKRNRRKIIKFF